MKIPTHFNDKSWETSLQFYFLVLCAVDICQTPHNKRVKNKIFGSNLLFIQGVWLKTNKKVFVYDFFSKLQSALEQRLAISSKFS